MTRLHMTLAVGGTLNTTTTATLFALLLLEIIYLEYESGLLARLALHWTLPYKGFSHCSSAVLGI